MKPKFVFGLVRSIAPVVKDGLADTPTYDIEVVCSTAAVDRSGEVIDQAGWDLGSFRANPVFMAAHLHRLGSGGSPVIGSFQSIAVEGTGEKAALVGKVKFADTELGREYRALYRDGHMRAVSVGFMPKGGENRTLQIDGKPTKLYAHTAAELYEVSAVAVPCNQEALVRMGLDGSSGFQPESIDSLAMKLAEAMSKVGRSADDREAAAAILSKAITADFTEQLDGLKAWLLEQLDEIKLSLPDTVEGSHRHAGPGDGDIDPDAAAGGKDTGANGGHGLETRATTEEQELRRRFAALAGRQ